MGAHDLSRFRLLFLAGERCDPDTLLWAQAKLGVPVIDHWWQTELGWPALANCVGLGLLPEKPGSPTRPVPGYDIRVLDDSGAEAGPGQIGKIVIKLPLPPGALPTLWHNDEGFVRSYLVQHEGYYLTGDAGRRGRVCRDESHGDIINVAGCLSTGGMERIARRTCRRRRMRRRGRRRSVEGDSNQFCGSQGRRGTCRRTLFDLSSASGRDRPIGGFKIAGRERPAENAIRKILRGAIKRSPTARPTMPATIEDPAVLADIGDRLKAIGYPK